MPHAREIISFFIAPPIASAKTPSRQRDDPNLAKTLSFSVRASAPRARGSSLPKAQSLCSPFQRCSHRAVAFPSVASPQAPVRPSFRQSRDHCGALRIFLRWQLRVKRSPILWLGARRQGIARSAALHLDCARSAEGGLYRLRSRSYARSEIR